MPLTEVEKNDFAMHFLLLDKDSDGQIDVEDMGRLLRAVGLFPTDAEVVALVGVVDPDGTGKVAQEPLLAVVESLMPENTPEEAVREAFKVLTENGNGFLSTAQLRHILLNLGAKLTHEQADEVIADAEKDGEGHIAVDELVTMLMTRSSFGAKAV